MAQPRSVTALSLSAVRVASDDSSASENPFVARRKATPQQGAARAIGLRTTSLTVILGTLGGRVGPRQQPRPPGDQPENRMITYIGLLSFTDKGIQTVKDTTKRAAAAKELAKKLGVNMREVFWTMGECDMVCVLEADDENALVAFNLATAVQGNVRSRSLRAYSAKDMDKILAKLP